MQPGIKVRRCMNSLVACILCVSRMRFQRACKNLQAVILLPARPASSVSAPAWAGTIAAVAATSLR